MKRTPFGTNRGLAPSDIEGFTLMEMLIYVAIFSVMAIFLLSVLTSVTRTQVRQGSGNEVSQELSFVASTIERLVRESSSIENPTGIASGTLILSMGDSARNITKIYADQDAVYMEEIPSGSQSGTPVALTNDKVKIGNFSVTKLENPGGLAVVQAELTLTFNTANPQAAITRSWKSAIGRISAATFDSSLLPNADAVSDLGSAVTRWRNLYISGNASVPGTVGLGTTPPTAPTRLKAAGDIGFSASTYGVILVSPGGTCYRLGVSNAGVPTTTVAGCP